MDSSFFKTLSRALPFFGRPGPNVVKSKGSAARKTLKTLTFVLRRREAIFGLHEQLKRMRNTSTALPFRSSACGQAYKAGSHLPHEATADLGLAFAQQKIRVRPFRHPPVRREELPGVVVGEQPGLLGREVANVVHDDLAVRGLGQGNGGELVAGGQVDGEGGQEACKDESNGI